MRRSTVATIVLLTGVVCALQVSSGLAETADQKRARAARDGAKSNAALKSLAASNKSATTSKKSGLPKKPAAPAFDAKAAPAPEKSLEAFVKAARSATSMTALLQFLPPEERQALEAMQKRYDPKDAAKRRVELAKDKMLSRETVEHLTSAPYDTRLKFLKRIATKIVKINSAKVEGDKAKVQVDIAIDDKINGQSYTRSTATVGLVGVGNRWYFSTFKESNVATRE